MVVELWCGCRVGDEKEGVVKQLQQERHQFEKHIGDVLGQQEALLKEREGTSSILSCDQPWGGGGGGLVGQGNNLKQPSLLLTPIFLYYVVFICTDNV